MRTKPSFRSHLPNGIPRSVAVLAAVGISLLMLSSGGAAAAMALTSSNLAAGPSPTLGPMSHPTIKPMTGTQLASGPFTSDGGTPLEHQPLAKATGIAPLGTPISFTVGFDLQNQQDLANVISAQSTPGSPLYQHWLSPAQEMAMFGPDPTLVQNTINYYTSLGFTVGTEGPISISFKGTVGQADDAFHTVLSNVVNGSSGPEIMNSLPLEIPQPLSGSIASVNGFEGNTQFKPALLEDPQFANGASNEISAVSPAIEKNFTNESEAYNYTNAAYYWFEFYDGFAQHNDFWQIITPASLNAMYDASPLLAEGYSGNSTPGEQVTIAIVMAGGINPSDMQGFSRMVYNNPNQILDRLEPVPVDHEIGINGTQNFEDGGSMEMALDIEYSSTMAPGAKIEPVYGPCLCTNVLDDDYATIFGLSHMPNIISNSWGGSEDNWGTSAGPSFQNAATMHNYFMLFAARGATVLASSGDGGGFDTGSGILSGSYPATDPYVLAVNGIRTAAASSTGQLYPSPSSFGQANISITESPGCFFLGGSCFPNYPVHVNKASEMAYQSYWYEPLLNTTLYSAAPQASGGFGTSYWYNQTWFQHGIGVPDLGRSLGSGVSAEADFNESIYFGGNFNLGWGGTSFACPTTAGMFADIIDYVQAHGHSGYLGNGNAPVFEVGNAWRNGNLSLNPFFDITNGTSYWGNHGVQNGWQWPPGQVFPRDDHGAIAYGNTTTGWDFPSGWGVINVMNFAQDLEHLDDLPATVTTTNSAGSAFNYGAWANMATNGTYYFHVNATGSLAASNPTLIAHFFPKNLTTQEVGAPINTTIALTPTSNPTPGFSFQLNTGNPTGIDGPGLVVFTLGNASDVSSAFGYTWISWAPTTGGSLQVQVVYPTGGSIVGGSGTFTIGAGYVFPPITADPYAGVVENNLVIVHVTYNGVGVYNARVIGTIASAYDMAFEGSRALNVSQSYGAAHTSPATTISQTLTNSSGYAYVWTWNVIKPTNIFINATYASSKAETNVTMVPPPNIALTDNWGGKFSYMNEIGLILLETRQPITQKLEQLWAPNSINQSGWYDMQYVWQGERVKVNVNDYQGNAISGIKVWFGNYDVGRSTKFANYEASLGVVGVTNTSGTTAVTDSSGSAYLDIPQNESINSSFSPIYGAPIGTWDGPAGMGAIAADIPGTSNITDQISEPCSPAVINTPHPVLVSCDYNDSIDRNYTSTPALVMPDPVFAWTQTPSGTHRNFFATGTNVSFGVSVNLPSNDPWINYYGYNWPVNEYHVTNVTAFVDNVQAGTANPAGDNQFQFYNASGNLTLHDIANGTHELTLVVNASSGQTFTYTHRFVVGTVKFDDLGISNTYTQVPYDLNWTVGLPAPEINNKTFSQTLEVQYVTGGCSGLKCPIVVNLSEKIHDGVQNYNQSINLTMLNLDNFYSGSGYLPSGQYLLTLWLNANKSGNVTAQLPTYLVFADLNGSFTGPTPNEQVPLGNVTISYQYTGGYLSNASLYVFAQGDDAAPVYTAGIFVPAVGSNPRGGSQEWYATVPGAYRLVMDLGTPYNHVNITEWINVTLFANVIYINTTHLATSALGGMSAASVGTVLAIAGAILGFLIGLIAAPAFRGAPGAATTAKPTSKPWEDATGTSSAGQEECSVCHEHFATPFALHTHQKSAHGIEE